MGDDYSWYNVHDQIFHKDFRNLLCWMIPSSLYNQIRTYVKKTFESKVLISYF